MASFLDYYLFDRTRPEGGKTPAQEFLDEQQAAGDAAEMAARSAASPRPSTGCSRSGSSGKGIVRLRELFAGKDFDVTERRQHRRGWRRATSSRPGSSRSTGTCWSSARRSASTPARPVKSIQKEVKRRKKKEPDAPPARARPGSAAKRALKAERYRQIAVEKIYDFEGSRL